jgi:hypothetical protein
VSNLADDFTRRLKGIADPHVRAHAIGERIQRLEPHVAAELLESIWLSSCDGVRDCQQVLIDLAANMPLSVNLDYDFISALYEAAREKGLSGLAHLLLSPQSATPDFLENNNQFPDVELGRRKFMARGRDRDKLDRLLWDPSPEVIEILLSNPNLVERDVVAIAARRPNHPESLLQVFRHRRWLPRYQVKLALAANPHTPSDAVLALLPFLTAQHLEGIANDPTLNRNARLVARDLIVRRSSTPPEE